MSYHKSDNKYYGYIYIIRNTINNKVYIGQTRRTVGIRWGQHLLSVKTGRNDDPILYNAIKKYGPDNFYVQTLCEYSSLSKKDLIAELNREEIRYITEFNSIKPNGYNIQEGGKSPTNSLKCPVDKYTLNGILLGSYDSILEACEDEGESKKLNRIHISECCRGLLNSSSGYVWRFRGDPFNKPCLSDGRTRSVDQYSINGELIGHYDSFSEAVSAVFGPNALLKNYSHIGSCCRGDRNIAYGFVWRYAGDSFDKYDNSLDKSK